MKPLFLFPIGLCLYCLPVTAQTDFYNDGGVLYIQPHAIVHVEGGLQNKSIATLQNDGIIEITGNLTNDSTATFKNGIDNTSTERAVKMIGSSNQTINGNLSDTSSRYLYNLIIDKQTTSSPVQLFTNIDVKGSLIYGSATTGAATYTPTSTSTLTNYGGKGILKTYDDSNTDWEVYVTNPAFNAIRGYAALTINGNPTDGYIINRGVQGVGIGGLSRNVNQTGTAYIFPVGSTLNGYNATSMTFTTLGTSTDKIRGMFVDATNGVGSVSNYCSGCGSNTYGSGFNYYFSHDSCNENKPQWIKLNTMPRDHGYWSYTGNEADVYSVEMFPNSFSGFGSTAGIMMRIIKKSGAISAIPSGDWTPEITSGITSVNDILKYTTNTGCYTGTGVPGGNFVGFSSYQMIRSTPNVGLPIKLVSLTAQPIDNKYIALQWITAEEIDNKGFEVQRSIDGVDFSPIGWIDALGTGNTSTGYSYHYDDASVQAGITYYYRLHQVDKDGKTDDTYIVDAQLSSAIGGGLTLSSIYPNPSTGTTHIQINSPIDMPLTIELYNMIGQLLDHQAVNAPAGQITLPLHTTTLPAGNYKAVVRSPQQVFSHTITIIL